MPIRDTVPFWTTKDLVHSGIAELEALQPEREASRPNQSGLFAKEVFDRVAALLMLVSALIPLLLIALAVRIDSRGPILFRQPRYGKDGKVVPIHKFRTMGHQQTDLYGCQQAQRGDARVTRVGRFLRLTCLDELPQLWDVLCGRMSLVGPRPHPIGMQIDGAPAEEVIIRYMDRLRVKPGLTGLAQVKGNRGPVTSIEMGQQRIDLDNAYIENWTFWGDLVILLRTASVPFKEGSY